MHPEAGDVILRATASSGFEVIDAITHRIVAGPLATAHAAIAAAMQYGARGIWQQSIDNRGRVLGDPYKLATLGADEH